MELWGGVECTVNRVGDQFFDQVARLGHDLRPGDLDDWALGWYTVAADLAQDADARGEADRERNRRHRGVTATPGDGELPAVRGQGE